MSPSPTVTSTHAGQKTNTLSPTSTAAAPPPAPAAPALAAAAAAPAGAPAAAAPEHPQVERGHDGERERVRPQARRRRRRRGPRRGGPGRDVRLRSDRLQVADGHEPGGAQGAPRPGGPPAPDDRLIARGRQIRRVLRRRAERRGWAPESALRRHDGIRRLGLGRMCPPLLLLAAR